MKSNQPKTVLAINASRQRRNTHALLTQIGELLRATGIDVETVNLHDYDVRDCLGCLGCLKRGDPCPHDDDYAQLLQGISSADGLILGTPVHMASISGKLKTLLDRMFVQVHRPELAGIPLLTVATTGGSGLGRVRSYLTEVAVMMGLHPCGSIGRRAPEMARPVSEREVAKFSAAVLGGPRRHRPSLRQITFFHIVRALGTSFLPLDREFWMERGLDQARYFYPCRMGPMARLYGRIVGGIIGWTMRRVAARQ